MFKIEDINCIDFGGKENGEIGSSTREVTAAVERAALNSEYGEDKVRGRRIPA